MSLVRLNFGAYWNAKAPIDVTSYCASRFGIAAPRPVQLEAVRFAAETTEPGLMLVEAPTGEGKTELAFVAAEILAAKFGLHGLMLALPTRATSNAMFGRTLS